MSKDKFLQFAMRGMSVNPERQKRKSICRKMGITMKQYRKFEKEARKEGYFEKVV